ncbi:phosphoribosyltransferase [Stutzerimonas azotifigens]|uniref:phosphoribosyltransferase n=1 Tax=Stutzerimonas azotifigens TaxID=291995 RepID=UPI0004149172|nr:phosphoribosyltransferase [Stutzerimonas azotifigens]
MRPFEHSPLFLDRRQAGEVLADALQHLAPARPLVLALPRGGVPVGYPIARRLDAVLDLILVRKIGAPGNEELGLGAVIDGADPQWVVNEALIRRLAPPAGWFESEMTRQLKELERRRQRYCGDRPAPLLASREVILVDDGIATGATVRAALKGLRKAGVARLVLAVPVAPRLVVESLQPEVDELVCLAMPEPFVGVGLHYQDFSQTSDEEVIELLGRAASAA